MCGIAGSIGAIDDGIITAVKRAQDSMVHRGPDAQGLWTHHPSDRRRGVVLAHRRLAVIDLNERANQPMVDPASGCVIAYNGEVYNFVELRDQLDKAGQRFESESDTEVILKAYAYWGPSCVERFNGMFAVAIWDPGHSRVFLARDRMGIKPLYLAQVGAGEAKTVFFASELRALLATDRIDRRIDPIGLASFLWNGVVFGPHTLVSGIEIVPAGTAVTIDVDTGSVDRQRYWQMPGSSGSGKQAGAVDELRDRLESAVRSRLVSDVPLGVFLSGGVDSSAVAAIASQRANGQVRTFNISFDEAEYDEASYARTVADALGTQHHEIRVTESMFADHLQEALAAIDQPTFDGINTYFVSRAVREAGITVALAGTGGDELFGGYRSFVDIPKARCWSRRLAWAPQSLLRGVAGVATRLMTGRPGVVPPQTRWGKLGDVLASRGGLFELYQLAYGLFSTSFYETLSDGVDEQQVYYGVPHHRAGELGAMIDDNDPLHSISMLETSCFLGERLLRDTDWASMAVSLECRVPLIDHQIFEALARVDRQERFYPLGKKDLLKRLAIKQVDHRVFDRPKAGFVFPFDVWCRRALRDEVAQTLTDDELCRQCGLQPQPVARLWQAFLDQAPGMYFSRVWALFVLLHWCRQHRVTAA